ncbi:uncharacterized protein IWZ02DRAFT_149267 [Phyllosticta citriasiana]|uniref:Secreted protein n=1 Tax=Phyllosticta citriasiana TaxID=595635 RepID=A0ABR1KFJ9_9PEZI
MRYPLIDTLQLLLIFLSRGPARISVVNVAIAVSPFGPPTSSSSQRKPQPYTAPQPHTQTTLSKPQIPGANLAFHLCHCDDTLFGDPLAAQVLLSSKAVVAPLLHIKRFALPLRALSDGIPRA